MAKKRTKKQKIHAKLKQAIQPVKETVKIIEDNQDDQAKKLIIKDLMKTVWVALILGVILSTAVIYLKLGSGGLSGFFGGLTFGQK